MTPTVYVVDDDPSYLRAVARLLKASGFAVEPFESPREFLAQLRPDTPGCVVADLQMPAMDGLQLQTAVAQSHNPLPIVLLTGHGDVRETVRKTVKAFHNGAEDFLQKQAPIEELIDAVRRALVRDEIERSARAKADRARARLNRLTAREREVLYCVARGAPNKQTANELGITERTIKRHRMTIREKLGAPSLPEWMRVLRDAEECP